MSPQNASENGTRSAQEFRAKFDPLGISGPVLVKMKHMMGSITAMQEFRDRMIEAETVKGKVEHLRWLAHDEYPLFTRALDEPMKKFFSTLSWERSTMLQSTILTKVPVTS